MLALVAGIAGALAVAFGAPRGGDPANWAVLSFGLAYMALLVGGAFLWFTSADRLVDASARTILPLVGASAAGFVVAQGLMWDTYYLPSRVRVLDHVTSLGTGSSVLLVALAVYAALVIVMSWLAPRRGLPMTAVLLWACAVTSVLMKSGH